MAYAVVDTSDADEECIELTMDLLMDALEDAECDGVNRIEAIIAMGRLISMLLDDDERVGRMN